MASPLTSCLILAVVSVSTTSQSCERHQTGQTTPPEVMPGQDISSVITRRDQRCAGSLAPCRAFQVSADKTGVLRATLTWTNGQGGLRLEVWDGNDGDGTCCRSGESVSVAVDRGDRADVHVVLAEPVTKDTRQAFVLSTSIQEAQE
jgi:hypothetical protein